MSWVYKRAQAQPALYTVGYYDPEGDWEAESDHLNADLAADRVSFLNGNKAAGKADKTDLSTSGLYDQLIKQLGHPGYLNNEFVVHWGSFDTGAFWITKTNLDIDYHVTVFEAPEHDVNPFIYRVSSEKLVGWIATHKTAIRSVLKGGLFQ